MLPAIRVLVTLAPSDRTQVSPDEEEGAGREIPHHQQGQDSHRAMPGAARVSERKSQSVISSF